MPSFSPSFEQLPAYGNSKAPPKSTAPYARRATDGRASTLSPPMKNTNWVVAPEISLQEALASKKKEEERIGAGALSRMLPLSEKLHQNYVLKIALESFDGGSSQRTTIDVLQEMHHDDEEEKIALTQAASFAIQETPGEKFPWTVFNRDSGMAIAFYKRRTTNFASHLENSEGLQNQHGVNLELYGKTPLFENQKYRKKDDKEIIYHWASTKIKHASTLLRCIFFSKQVEMVTKHETPQDYKLVSGKSEKDLVVQSVKSKSVAASCKIEDDDRQMHVTVAPKVDPALIIFFLAMTAPGQSWYRGDSSP